MKKHLLLLFLLMGLFSSAQKIEQFYDYNWKPCDASIARFFSVIEFKDSIWSRLDYFIREKKLQMQGNYLDSNCKIPHGLFYYFHANGNLESTGSYVNGKRQNLWLKYYSNGMMEDSTSYINGNPVGISVGWHENGYMSDSTSLNNEGTGLKFEWFDNGVPASGGHIVNNSMQGKWVFFHKNGNMSATEVYNNGKLMSREYFDEKGEAIADTANRDKSAEFPGGPKAWNKYVLSKLYFPEQYKITGGDKAVVVVDAVIDEDGTVTNVEVSSPFYPAFDDIALRMMKGSPKWKPAIYHNRKIKSHIRQPVTFAQPEE